MLFTFDVFFRCVSSFLYVLLSIFHSSIRDHSPPPEHNSPAALNILLPLIRERDNADVSATNRAAAAEQLDLALTCLVNQLSVTPREGAIDEGADDADADETEVLDNAILGALVDLQTLILSECLNRFEHDWFGAY